MGSKKKSSSGNNDKIEFLTDFCNCLNDIGHKRNIKKEGRVFEIFLQYYLEKLGFTDVVLTAPGNDGGIDLEANYNLNVQISGVEFIDRYYISAKQFKPKDTSPKDMYPSQIRDLRGAIDSGKGIFITTGRVTDDAKRNALYSEYVQKDGSKVKVQKNIPVYVIDYKPLIDSFIELQLEFVKSEIKDGKQSLSLDKEKLEKIIDNIINGYRYNNDEVIKMPATIPKSHILGNVLLIPSPFKKYIVDKQINIRFDNKQEMKKINVNKACTYISKGMAAIYSKYKHNVDSIELEAIWEIDTAQNGVHVTIKEK